MWSKPARHIKWRWQKVIGVTLATVLCLVSAWVVFERFTAKAPAAPTIDLLPSPASDVAKAGDNQPVTAPSKPVAPVPAPRADASAVKQSVGAADRRQGVLRVGNPTDYPVRVALLAKKVTLENSAIAQAGESNYELPAHWDFAPEEGGAKGLIVSLPDRNLKVKKGDVLVAFAQDGSGRYWGPYVVSETALPVWSAKTAEWQLILQP